MPTSSPPVLRSLRSNSHLFDLEDAITSTLPLAPSPLATAALPRCLLHKCPTLRSGSSQPAAASFPPTPAHENAISNCKLELLHLSHQPIASLIARHLSPMQQLIVNINRLRLLLLNDFLSARSRQGGIAQIAVSLDRASDGYRRPSARLKRRTARV
eukprot:767444-Hanusia_phi.AAC.8